MRSKSFLGTAVALICLPVCGGWTTVNYSSFVNYYGDAQVISLYSNPEQINYVEKQIVSDIITLNGAPNYHSDASLPNGCGVAAGATILGFYDKYFDIISNWSSTLPNGRYKNQDAVYVPGVMNELYEEMNTNMGHSGNSENDFINGLRTYTQRLGFNITYDYLGNGNGLNYASMKNAFLNNKVVVFFIEPDYLYSISAASNSDTIYSGYLSANHILIAYGYYKIKYFLSSGTRTDTYINVSPCINLSEKQYYKVSPSLVSAYIVSIF